MFNASDITKEASQRKQNEANQAAPSPESVR